MSQALLNTIGNAEWVSKNEENLRKLFPETWTHKDNTDISILRTGFQFKLLGIDWRSEQELVSCMVYLTKIGVIQVQGDLIRRNPHSVFRLPADTGVAR